MTRSQPRRARGAGIPSSSLSRSHPPGFEKQVGEVAVDRRQLNSHIGSLHRVRNETDAPVTARVELRPGSLGFERAIQIAYGLAQDGLAAKNGAQKNLIQLGLLAEMADTQMTGALRILGPALRALARRARRKGVDRRLIARYCAW